jgi:outer membrane protein OmpA-like peptidoglycan-associated protein
MRLVTAFSGFVAAMLLVRAGVADPVRVHGRANAARPATGPQKDEQSWGVLGAAMIELPIIQQLGVGLEVGTLTLADGSPPADPRFADEEGAFGLTGALGLHVRPLARRDRGGWQRGLWAGSSVGAIRSEGLWRPTSEVSLGLDFLLSDAGFSAGPAVGWLHVYQPDSALRPSDANVLSVGVHGVLESGIPPVAPEPTPVQPLDRDGDGLVEPADVCPEEPEDLDGHADTDGCPDADNDEDEILDVVDQCPLEPEDIDGFKDDDGCPESDDDSDGIENKDDGCPLEPEDADGFADEDGCPDPDNDSDGLHDGIDQCPAEPEVKNGYADEDGCPDAEQVRVVGDKILLDQRVHFWTNSHVIRVVSYPLLSRVAQLLNQHPEYVHIEVQGHADARGDEGFNKRLSDERASAVMRFLTQRGVSPKRLSARGFGNDEPLLSGRDPRSHYLNRRVEFYVTREPVTPAVGAQGNAR